jgi:putative addiction module killer protein
MESIKKISHYMTRDGKSVFQSWFRVLNDGMAKFKITQRLIRAKDGNFGDTRTVGDGVHEMRVDHGPGYRIYYANDGDTIILLLCGGDKRTQDKDIKASKRYWVDYKKRKVVKDADSRS